MNSEVVVNYGFNKMVILPIAILILILLIYIYYKKSFQYWERKGVPTIKPSIPFGNLGSPFVRKGGFIVKITGLYSELKAKGAKIGGLYAGTKPFLLVMHPELIKKVLIQDFQHFSSHGVVFDKKEEPLQAHLFNLDGKEWRDMRVKLTSTFTSGKMKMMFQTLLNCAEQIEEFLDNCHEQNKPIDIKETMACYTTDVIGSCAFGLECNSFKYPDAQFRKYGRRILQPSIKHQIRRYFGIISPAILKLFKLSFTDKEITKFFIDVVRDMIDHRQSKNVSRNDFIQILINMEEQAKLEGKTAFTLEQMTAQVFVFFLAGFETSSTTMTFCLYELAHHLDIQDKLREEIVRTIKKYNGKLTYEATMEMKYLDQVVNETLRKYPTGHTLPRKCTQDYEFPDGSKVDNGTKVFISILGLHKDEEYHPNPEQFNPDRFSDENKHKIVPYTFLPFGDGPRICIALRFGVMQTKVGICLLLRKYRLYPHKSLKYPIEFDNKAAVLSPKGTVLLTTERV